MSLLRLAIAHLDLTCAFLAVVFQSFALLTRGKDHLSSPRGWLDLTIWVLTMSAVILRGHSALDTARLLSSLRHEAEQTLEVSQEAQNGARHALLKSQRASEKAEQASRKADSAESYASSADRFSRQTGGRALKALNLTHAAQAEVEAQHRALRSVHIGLELSGPVPPGYKDSSLNYTENDFPSVYLYSLDADANNSDGFKFGGDNIARARGDRWSVSLKAELMNKGFPVGEDIRTLSSYRSLCIDLISQLGLAGHAMPTPLPGVALISVQVTVEVNGSMQQQPASFSALNASASHVNADGKPLYCVTLNTSLDGIYEQR